MAKKISETEAVKLGVNTNHEIMDNGEKRFRLTFSDGSSYIRTEAPLDGSWQNSHYHTSLQEIYIVQKGWIVFVEYHSSTNRCIFYKVNEGQFHISIPKIPHNVYVSPGSKFHTVKFGDLSVNDWIKYESLDTITKVLTEKELLEKCIRES